MSLLEGALYACPVCHTWRPFRGYVGRDGIGQHVMEAHPRSPLAADFRVVRSSVGLKSPSALAAIARKRALPVAFLALAVAGSAFVVVVVVAANRV